MTERVRLGIGYLAQEPSVFRNLTVKENLDIALFHSGFSKSLLRKRREELVEEFNLVSFLDRFGFQLSGGERRRCEVARSLAVGESGPKYLLLDEPFAGVDPIAVNDLQKLINSLKLRGIGVLITDHNVRATLAITDRTYILNEGTIIANGTPYQVAQNLNVKENYLGTSFQI
jgi:lipopolysaccharide export system ATP-binding protein